MRQLQPKRVDNLEDGVKLERTQWGEVRAENKCRNHHICFLNYSRGFESWYSHVDVICLIVLEAFGLSALVLLNLILLTLANSSHKLKELVKNHKHPWHGFLN